MRDFWNSTRTGIRLVRQIRRRAPRRCFWKRIRPIASEEAAQVYGLEVLKHKINDLDNNTTRFVIVTNTRKFVKNAKKMSIVFETANEAGTLYNLLSHIIYNGLNMNKIESRPIEGREWEFRFFVDFEGNIDDPRVINALRGIEEESKKIKLLGNY